MTSVIAKADERVTDLRAERDDDGAGDDAKRDEAVHAGVIAVRDHGRARQPPTGPQPNLRSEFVAEEADHSRGGQDPEMRELLRVDQPLDRLVERHASRDEDGKNDG